MIAKLKRIINKTRRLLNFPDEAKELLQPQPSIQNGNLEFSLSNFKAFHQVLACDTLLEAQLQARKEAFSFICSNLKYAKTLKSREEVLDFALSAANTNGIFCEFGVATGRSINYISSKTQNTVYGFDSFEGMPEKWNEWDIGSLSMNGELPQVNENVKLLKGLFPDTIDEAHKLFKGQKISFCHIDCDLYSSTKFVFDNLAEFFKEGTIIVFDEFFNHPSWRECEYKAWMEFVSEYAICFEYIAFNCYESSVAVKINQIGKMNSKKDPENYKPDEIISKKYFISGQSVEIGFFAKDIYVLDDLFSGSEYPLNKIKGYIEPKQILDIGANIGAASILFAKEFPEAKVHAFEPLPQAYELLKKNGQQVDKIEAYPFGLFDKNCQKDLHVGTQSAASSIHKNSNSSEKSIKIEMKSIADFIAENNIDEISILKIDTEGCEKEIITAIPDLDKVSYIFLEYHSETDRMDLDKFLADNFYLFFSKIHRPHRGINGYFSKKLAKQYPELIEQPISIKED